MTRKLLFKAEVWAEMDEDGEVQGLIPRGWSEELPKGVSKEDLGKAAMKSFVKVLGGKVIFRKGEGPEELGEDP